MGSHSGDRAGMSRVEEDGISDPTVEIKIKTLDSQTYTLRVDRCVPVPALKEQVAVVTGISSEQQRLICSGRVLKDDQLLSAYHVEEGHTLHLVVREPMPQSQNMNDHTGPNYPPTAPEAQGPPGGPRVFVQTFSMTDQMQGSPSDITRIFSALMSSLGVPLTRSGNVTDGARAVPDSMTTLFQYLDQMTAEFALANGEEPISPSHDNDYVQRPVPSRVAFRRGQPRVESLAEVLQYTRQLLINQTAETLNRLATDLQFQVNVTDAPARIAIQSNAMRSGIILRNLGALLLELSRATMMLRMGLTPADAVVTAGSAVFVNGSGPNPIMVQPFPNGPRHSSPGLGPSPVPRNAGIRIETSVFPGVTNLRGQPGPQLFPGASSGLPEVNLRPIRLFGIVPEPVSPGLDSPVMAGPQQTSANAAGAGGSATGGLSGDQTGIGNGRPVSDEIDPLVDTETTNTIGQPNFSAENAVFFSNVLRQLMPYISQNSASGSAAGPSSAARDEYEDGQSSDSKRQRME